MKPWTLVAVVVVALCAGCRDKAGPSAAQQQPDKAAASASVGQSAQPGAAAKTLPREAAKTLPRESGAGTAASGTANPKTQVFKPASEVFEQDRGGTPKDAATHAAAIP